tara:strand:- start:109049 stop:109540 length:492 start_codon:yes stop_codon:yes gene_type:complete
MLSSEAQEKNILKFPESYFGKYIGTLKMNSKKGTKEYAMEFHLLPTDSVGKYRYTLVYGEGEQRQERLYTLYTQDAENGEYVVDENNGIVLDDKVIDNRMYALFEVQGTLLTTFITFETDHLLFEIAVAKREDKNISGGQDRDTPQVISYPITTVQRAVLIKQ